MTTSDIATRVLFLQGQADRAGLPDTERTLIFGRRQADVLMSNFYWNKLVTFMGMPVRLDENFDGIMLEVQPQTVVPPKRRFA